MTEPVSITRQADAVELQAQGIRAQLERPPKYWSDALIEIKRMHLAGLTAAVKTLRWVERNADLIRRVKGGDDATRGL